MEIVRIDGLEIDQDLAFQRRSWTIERVGWVLMGLVVLAAAVGLLGSGPLSRARADVPGVMSVEYQRVARLETSETLTLRVAPAATAGDAVRVLLNQAFLTAAKIERVEPPPARVDAAAGGLVYVFTMAEPRVPLVVRITYEPRQIGPSRGIVSLESVPGAPSLIVQQLVYP